ncbi:MAG: hypothetical protein AABZ44_02105 [Elusimicrobiota bacterium]
MEQDAQDKILKERLSQAEDCIKRLEDVLERLPATPTPVLKSEKPKKSLFRDPASAIAEALAAGSGSFNLRSSHWIKVSSALRTSARSVYLVLSQYAYKAGYFLYYNHRRVTRNILLPLAGALTGGIVLGLVFYGVFMHGERVVSSVERMFAIGQRQVPVVVETPQTLTQPRLIERVVPVAVPVAVKQVPTEHPGEKPVQAAPVVVKEAARAVTIDSVTEKQALDEIAFTADAITGLEGLKDEKELADARQQVERAKELVKSAKYSQARDLARQTSEKLLLSR